MFPNNHSLLTRTRSVLWFRIRFLIFFTSHRLFLSLAIAIAIAIAGQSKLVWQRQTIISSTLQLSSFLYFITAVSINPNYPLHAPVSMDILKSARCISTPFRPPPLILHSRLAIALSLDKRNTIRKCRNMCAASNSDTITESSEITSKKEQDDGDLKSWMEKNGLPPSKVMLKERPSHDSNYHSIHYVAAREDLQVSTLHFLNSSMELNSCLFQILHFSYSFNV